MPKLDIRSVAKFDRVEGRATYITYVTKDSLVAWIKDHVIINADLEDLLKELGE